MKKGLIVLTLVASCACFAGAEQWKTLGTRPMGMGGAFVAMAQGPMAQYWNPGGLAMASSASISGMELPVTANIEMTGGIMKNASEIGDMASKFSAISDAQADNTAADADQISAFVKTLTLLSDMNDSGKGAMVEVAGGANFKFSKVAISVNNFTSVGLNPFIDTTNIGLGNISGDATSGITMAGGDMTAPPAEYVPPTATIANAITDLGGFSKIEDLICGTAGCLATQLAGLDTKEELANALVNQAIANGVTAAELTEAANQIAEYAPAAAPIIENAISGNSYANNTSNLTVGAASFTEIALGYGRAMKFLDGLSIGGNIKMINGRLASSTFQFMNNDDTGDVFKNMMDDSKSSWAPALDVGALWDVEKKYSNLPLHPKVGLVIRNINSPKFDRPDSVGGTYKLDRQARLGFALQPMRFWNLALDVDVTKNKTAVRGFDSRQLAMGTEVNIINRRAFNIPLRAGLMKNLAESSSKMAYTFGTGINLLFMHFDVAGAISSDRTTLDDKKVPTRASVSASFGLLF